MDRLICEPLPPCIPLTFWTQIERLVSKNRCHEFWKNRWAGLGAGAGAGVVSNEVDVEVTGRLLCSAPTGSMTMGGLFWTSVTRPALSARRAMAGEA